MATPHPRKTKTAVCARKHGRIRLLLVDDHRIVREGLKEVLGRCPGLEVVGDAASAQEAVGQVIRNQPDVVLLDLQLKESSGLDACRTIRSRAPNTRVLVLSAFVDQTLARQAIEAGANGYVLKELDSDQLCAAIADVAAGRPALAPAVAQQLMDGVRTSSADKGALATGFHSLSRQEQRVVSLVADGKTNKEIGAEMGLSDRTVRNYLSNIFAKLDVTRRSQLATIYAQQARSA
jgi:DNA-binding NarL/FixJ family response regulator